MYEIAIHDFKQMLSFDVITFPATIEVCVQVAGQKAFRNCWLGKKESNKRSGTAVYWYGLKADGSGAYAYATLAEMMEAKVFDGKSLVQIWHQIQFVSIDGMHPKDRVRDYLRPDGDFPRRK